MAGVTPQSVSDWENEKSKPARGTLRSIANALGLPIEAFQEGGPSPVSLLETDGQGGYLAPAAAVVRVTAHAQTLSAAHSEESAIRLQLFRDAMRRLAESGPTVEITLATELLQEMQAAWAIAEAKRSAAGGAEGAAGQRGG